MENSSADDKDNFELLNYVREFYYVVVHFHYTIVRVYDDEVIWEHAIIGVFEGFIGGG